LEKFGELTTAEQVNDLHALLKPYLLRRVKEDVEKSLPPKEETILEVSLTPIQKKYYKAIYERNTAFLYKGTKPSNAPSLMNVMMELRKCCNHPYLVRGAEDRILADAANQIIGTKDAEGKDVVLDYTKLFAEQIVKSSGKMVLLSKVGSTSSSGWTLSMLICSLSLFVVQAFAQIICQRSQSADLQPDGSSAGFVGRIGTAYEIQIREVRWFDFVFIQSCCS
jgi:SNF2 family DNA or RNA helicase